jgi:hypothetical protein
MSGTLDSHAGDKPMEAQEFDLTSIRRGDTYVARLPNGRLLELEWLDSEANAIRVRGFVSQAHYDADEEYRCAGFEPLLRCFHEHVCMKYD